MFLKVGDYAVDLNTSLGGVVFKAHHRVTKAELAAKRISASGTGKQWRTAGEVEALVTASSHPRLVTVLYTEHKDGSLWLITEYYEAGSIHEYLTTHTITDRQAAVIIQDCVAAVCHVHSLRPEGLVQPGIRTDHLMVTVIDGQPRVKLNVATSALLDSSVKAPSLVDDPYAPTASYLPPEMFANNPPHQYEKSGDVYALGLIIWSFLHRKPKKGLEAPRDGAEPIGYSWVKKQAQEWMPFNVEPEDGLLEVLVAHMISFDPKDIPGIKMVKDIMTAHLESDNMLDSGESKEKLMEAYDRMSKMCDRYQQLGEHAGLMNQQLLKRNEVLTADHDRVQAEYRELKDRHNQAERQAQQDREVMDEKCKLNDKLHQEKEQLSRCIDKMVEDEARKQQRHQEKTQFERVIECLDYRSIVRVACVVCIVVGVLAVLLNLSIHGRYCQIALAKKENHFMETVENHTRERNELIENHERERNELVENHERERSELIENHNREQTELIWQNDLEINRLGNWYNITRTALRQNKRFMREQLNGNTAPIILQSVPLMHGVEKYVFTSRNHDNVYFGNDYVILNDYFTHLLDEVYCVSKYIVKGVVKPEVLEMWTKPRTEIDDCFANYVLNNGSIIIQTMYHGETRVYSEDCSQKLTVHRGDFGVLCGVVGDYVVYCKQQQRERGVYNIHLYSSLSHELVATLPRSVTSCAVSVCRHHTGYLAVIEKYYITLDIYTPSHQHVTRVDLEDEPLYRNAVATVGDVIIVVSKYRLYLYNWAGELLDVLTTNQLGVVWKIQGVGGAGDRLMLADGGWEVDDVQALHVYDIY